MPALEVHRRKNESFDGLLRRFSRRTQQSGLLLEVRKRKSYRKKPNERQRKISKLYRMKKTEEIEQSKRDGTYVPEKRSFRRR